MMKVMDEAIKTRLIQVVMVAVMSFFGFGVNEGYQHYQASEYGVEKGQVSYAQEQLSFYKRNEVCMVDLQPIQVQSSPELSISILACPTGDVRIMAHNSQTNQRFSKWLATNQIAMVTDSLSFSLFNKAYADEQQFQLDETQWQAKVCGVYYRGTQVVEIIKTHLGCFENTYNGYGQLIYQRQVVCPC